MLAEGWRERLVEVKNANTAPTAGAPPRTGWCLSKEDICVAKLCAFREKDRNYVGALLDAALVDSHAIAALLAVVPEHAREAATRAQSWLKDRD